jgi:hypothetical protein
MMQHNITHKDASCMSENSGRNNSYSHKAELGETLRLKCNCHEEELDKEETQLQYLIPISLLVITFT